MSDLRNKLVKLAYDNPKLRGDLLPLINKVSSFPLGDLDRYMSKILSELRFADEVVDDLDDQISQLRDKKDRVEHFRSQALAIRANLAFLKKAYEYVKENPDDLSNMKAFPRDASGILDKIRNLQKQIRSAKNLTEKEEKFLVSLSGIFSDSVKVIKEMRHEIEKELE